MANKAGLLPQEIIKLKRFIEADEPTPWKPLAREFKVSESLLKNFFPKPKKNVIKKPKEDNA